jgi:hypothetical protein
MISICLPVYPVPTGCPVLSLAGQGFIKGKTDEILWLQVPGRTQLHTVF